MDLFKNPGSYAKFYVALTGAFVALLTAYFGDAQWLPILVSFLTAIGVYVKENN